MFRTKTEAVSVDVVQQMIDEGVKQSNDCCPLALGLTAAGLRNVSVGRTRCCFYWDKIPGLLISYSLDFDMREFVRAFDDGLIVVPTTFVLRPTPPFEINNNVRTHQLKDRPR